MVVRFFSIIYIFFVNVVVVHTACQPNALKIKTSIEIYEEFGKERKEKNDKRSKKHKKL